MSGILIIGGGGMVGQKLAASLARDELVTQSGQDVTLFDIAFPTDGAAAAKHVTGSVTDPALVRTLTAARPAVVFYLASIVSGEAEVDFDLGWHTNMQAFWDFLEYLRVEHISSGGSYVPRVVFTSSIAVFGGPYPEKIDDDFPTMPQTSYGAQKAIAELMLADLSRKGIVDGISIRLPTICVRPGAANKAASSFFSGIIREPLNGQEALLPVSDKVRHWHASPRAAVGFLRRAAELDLSRLSGRTGLNMPGVSCTVSEQIEALREIAGNDAVALIRPQPDPAVDRIVKGWPRNFAPTLALDLGFVAQDTFGDIIQVYIEDDLSHTSRLRLR